ncbi:MAG: hypothetical protein A2Y58_00450 [Chloroflexi bacterium RBG_13_51_52]|nr:MAG: hypothetical protein A2Y58_00450 [Chloroflexi bacterium RBG_13_51_52]
MNRAIILIALGVLLISTLIAVVSCSTSSQPSSTAPNTDTQTKPPPGGTPGNDFTPGANIAVIIEGLAFSPSTITVDAGTTVTWTNQDTVNHTVTSRMGIFDSGIMSRGSSFSRTFTNFGDFEYYCTLHPNMVGHVIVK